MRALLLRSLVPLVAVLLGTLLLVRRFDRNSGSRDFDDALPSAPAPQPGPPAFRRVTPERGAPAEPQAEPAALDTDALAGQPLSATDDTKSWEPPRTAPEKPAAASRPPPAGAPAAPAARSAGSGDWMEELRRSFRQQQSTGVPPARATGVRSRRPRVPLGRDAAITLGLLAVAALVGLGMTAFVVGGAGESATPTGGVAGSVVASPSPSVSDAGSAGVTPSAAISPSRRPATPSPSPSPALPVPGVSLGESHTDGVPHIEISWPEVDGASAYEFAFDRNDGEWEEVGLDPATATSRTIRIVPDRAYRFRVRAEVNGEMREWAVSETVRLAVLDEDADAVQYEGAWEPAFHDAYVDSDVQFSTIGGSSATLAFEGVGVAWRGPLGPARGRAEVFVDGESEGAVDTGGGTFSPQNILFATSFDEAGEHELQIDVEGTAGRPAVAIDAFYVLVEDPD